MPAPTNISSCAIACITLSIASFAAQAQLTNNNVHIVVGNNAQLRIDNNMTNTSGATITSNGITQVNGSVNNAGTIRGSGNLNYTGGLLHTGTIAPGNNNIGELTLIGNYNNGTGILDMAISSANITTGFDKLTVQGPVTASGTLQVAFVNGYNPPTNQTFDLVTGTTVSGTFATTLLPTGWSAIYLSNKVQLVSSSVLPIVLVYFKGKHTGASNQLSWMVSTDGDPATTLTLERSDDAKTFHNIYSTLTTRKHGEESFIYDDNKTKAAIHYYRLKITTPGEAIMYSDIVALQSGTIAEPLVQIAPNPIEANSQSSLLFNAVQADDIKITIADMGGKIIVNQSANVVQGANSLMLNLPSQMMPGIYLLRVLSSSGQERNIKFVQQ